MKPILIPLCALALVGCVDSIPTGGGVTGSNTQQQSVLVQPEFVLANTDGLPAGLTLSQLDFTVSEIRFAPALGADIAYSTKSPMFVSFDVENGELVQGSEAIELPEAGRYIVSIRFDPIADENDVERSFAASGSVAQKKLGAIGYDDSKSEPTPQPILFDEKDEHHEQRPFTTRGDAPNWTAYRYESRRSIFFTLNDVELEEGEQVLEFNFDAANWGGAVIDSLATAVRGKKPNSATVDVTQELESNGSDYARFIETGSVSQSTER